MSGISLQITAGPQAGASMLIASGALVTLGQGLSNDVVLRDPSIGNQQISVQAESSSVVIGVTEGQVLVGGQLIEQGMQCRLPANETVVWGSTQLKFVAEIAGRSQPAEAELASTTVAARWYTTRKAAYVFAGSALVCGLLVVVASLWQGQLAKPANMTTVSAEMLLEESEFSHLRVSRNGESVVISGFLPSREAAMGLSELLDKSGYKWTNAVQIGDELAAKVQDVFRVNGVAIKAQATQAGEVEITAPAIQQNKLQHLEKIVYRDIPQLHKLIVHPSPASLPFDGDGEIANKVMPGHKQRLVKDPGKRVTMVVSNDPAYVVTEDNSHYYIGSLLPTGHRISAIDGGHVSIVKAGVTTQMQY